MVVAEKDGIVAFSGGGNRMGNKKSRFGFLRARHIRLGSFGEKTACRLLKKKHFDILCRNYRSPDRSGEADIVARDGEVLCFIEVKTRRWKPEMEKDSTSWLDRHQVKRIENAARDYMNRIKCVNLQYRFDLVEIAVSGGMIRNVRHWQGGFGRHSINGN